MPGWLLAKRNAKKYDQLFLEAGLSGAGNKSSHVGLPSVVADRHIFNQYVIRVSGRVQLQVALQQHKMGTEVYYPIPMHLQECFAYLGHGAGSYPESERAAKETVALPIYPELSEAELSYVVESIREFFLGIR
jgi:dTDP-4-amino-4,6-dideoxygalactose transaminase